MATQLSQEHSQTLSSETSVLNIHTKNVLDVRIVHLIVSSKTEDTSSTEDPNHDQSRNPFARSTPCQETPEASLRRSRGLYPGLRRAFQKLEQLDFVT
jgi:hypothetical protein